MARIPEETLQQVLAATDIVDLVGRYVKLRRVGTNWRGLCPFHGEKTPSFYVNPARGSYHCFGCGVGGTAIRFVMEHDGLQFMDAVKRLADSAGIRIQEEVWDANAERTAKIRNGLVKLHRDISAWFHLLLMKGQVAEEARAYLKSRGINAATAKSWEMGYAPASTPMLMKWAEEHKYTENLLVAGGILARGDEDSGRGGQIYARFRHRLMFPIRNDYGEVIAFSGRLLDSNAKAAKYLNSPETMLFNKSKVLFGLDKSKRAIIKANRAVVCEGQIDMIMAFESGFENVVAPLGTAFTEFHARMLKRHAEEVVLCFDSDNAGYKAAERAFHILAPTGLVVKVAPLPQGEDPDSLIRKEGPQAFQAKLDDARDFFDHMIDYASSTRNMAETREKTRFAGDMATMIQLLDNNIARDAAIQKVCVRLNILESDFRKQVARLAKSIANQQQKAAAGKNGGNGASGSGASGATDRPEEAELPPPHPHARQMIRLAVTSAEVLALIRTHAQLDALAAVPGCELLELVFKSQSDLSTSGGLSAFLTTLTPAEERAFSRVVAEPPQRVSIETALQTLQHIEFQGLENLYQNVTTRLRQPGLAKDEVILLQQEVIRLKGEIGVRRAQLPSKQDY
ncbi:DNA primase [Verrucomicrobium spinosum]|uniref:DNA primase n=1 Tax=Verrucomicrobium spinosum TaxID=2736 RepID=UPI0002FE7AFF|nr:DNA primase [Verrucomicrobium spinosum]